MTDNLKLNGFECDKCGEWIVVEATDDPNTFLSDHFCGRQRFGILTGVKDD